MKSGEARRLIKIFLLRTILCRRKREKRKSGGSKEEAKQIPVEENRCACCLNPFLVTRGVRCNDCGARSCRKGCCRWDPSDKAWHCIFCRQQRHWLNKTGLQAADDGSINEKDLHRYFSTAKSRVYVAGVENAAASSGLAAARPKEEANTMETVRDFIEKIVEGLIGKVDDTPIDRLYDHPAYNKLLEKHIVSLVDALTRMAVVLQLSLSNNPSADSPSMAHTALREIVERAVEEARKLPGLGGSSETGSTREGRNIVDHSYEDLLATAILNKVIEKYQKEQVDGNSNVLHGKPVTAAKCAINEIEAGLDEGVEEGCSSLEPLSQDECSSDCSAPRSRHLRNQPEPLSLTIEERIEEVTTVYTSDEDPRDNDVPAIRNTHRVPFPELGMDIIDPSQDSEDSQDEVDTPTTHMGLVSPIESWEENWLFQKKRVQTQADPVAMLVPNPSADYKALIGDKDAEDTSDLSECSSAQSDEEIEKELMEAINNVVPRTPTDLVFENGLDNHLEASTDVPKNQETEKTDPEALLRTNVAGNEDKIEHEVKTTANNVESSLMNASEAKEAGKEVETSEKVEKKPVPERTGVVDDNPKIEVECRSTAEEFEKKVEGVVQDFNNSTNGGSSTEPRELDRNDPSSCNGLEEVLKVEENVSDVPKTPSCTPTRTSETEVAAGNVGNAEALILKEENALNSSECTKKSIHVDEDTLETFEEEEKSDEQRNDFQAEDIQQESEYTEHYDTATQRHLDSLTKTEIPVVENGSTDAEPDHRLPVDDNDSRCREAVALAKATSASRFSLRHEKEQTQLSTPPRPGTIAEREHKKWENAPPIENNPYSQENIQKRLWERQYTRRPSDIPGINAELPKSNGTDLEVVLAPQEPDIKRFGRDYYINDSRSSINEKGRRSASSTMSRPSSSLSQGSSSTGPDQEQQVSFQLEKFEEASLRGSLSRWTYRDPYSSPHFAVNPLLHMELDGSKPASTDRVSEQTVESDTTTVESILWAADSEKLTERRQIDLDDSSSTASERFDESSMIMTNWSLETAGRVAYNPLYKLDQPLACSSADKLKLDRDSKDSGMYSIDPLDLGYSKKQEDGCKTLGSGDWSSDQILSSNGRRYWSFNGHKYHTFGGIKNSRKSIDESDEGDLENVENEHSNAEVADFAKLKFQTFGGIKKSKGVPTCRKITLKPSLRIRKGLENAESSQSNSGLQNDGNRNLRFIGHSHWLREHYPEDHYATSKLSQSSNRPKPRSKRKQSSKSYGGQARTIGSRSEHWSSSDDWQDDDSNVPDRTMMAKFLKDVSNKAKSRNSENPAYFFNTSRRKLFENSRRVRSLNKHRSYDDNGSLKLEPPIVPQVVERSFESLRDLRVAGKSKKLKSRESKKKQGVMSLSNVTIW
ncbi:uncharacterized protein LOC143210260 isoform X3 [Lasioglossum baleicum]|uniref:uncharacterized protein LOC143210260 isoform X3 n=1 Tax=Lasioglossum baleicum TaxID=434251 RepID=UPI003FCE2C5B